MEIEGKLVSVQHLFGHLVALPGQAAAASPAYDTQAAGVTQPLAKERVKNPRPQHANLSEALTSLLARQQWPEVHLLLELGLVIAHTYAPMKKNAGPLPSTKDCAQSLQPLEWYLIA